LEGYLGGTPPRPPWVGFAEVSDANAFCEAEQRFLLLFLEKEEYPNPGDDFRLSSIDTAELWVTHCLLRSRTMIFASFSWKKKKAIRPFGSDQASSKTPT
jgi:hypothetical protein